MIRNEFIAKQNTHTRMCERTYIYLSESWHPIFPPRAVPPPILQSEPLRKQPLPTEPCRQEQEFREDLVAPLGSWSFSCTTAPAVLETWSPHMLQPNHCSNHNLLYIYIYTHTYTYIHYKPKRWSSLTQNHPNGQVFAEVFLSFSTEGYLSLSLHKYGQAEEHWPTMQLLLAYYAYEMYLYLVIMWVILRIHKQNHSPEQWWDKNVNPTAVFLRDLLQYVISTDRLFTVQCSCS